MPDNASSFFFSSACFSASCFCCFSRSPTFLEMSLKSLDQLLVFLGKLAVLFRQTLILPGDFSNCFINRLLASSIRFSRSLISSTLADD